MENDVILQGAWLQTLGVVVTAVVSLVGYGFSRLVYFIIGRQRATEREKEAFQALLEGMAKAQDEFVRQAKAVNADGKLTREEAVKAQQIAYAHALTIAKGPVKEMLLAWSKERVGSIIKQFLARLRQGRG